MGKKASKEPGNKPGSRQGRPDQKPETSAKKTETSAKKKAGGKRLYEGFGQKTLRTYRKTSQGSGTLLAPLPCVLVTTAESRDGDAFTGANIMTAGWTGIVNTKPPMLSLSVRPERLTHARIRATGEFVVNLVTADLAARVDFCGVRSGRDVDKWAVCGFHPMPSPALTTAPLLAEAPVSLACKVRSSELLGTHELFLADIVSLEVADEIITPDGKIDLDSLNLLSYFHGSYHELSQVSGFFGFSVAKAATLHSRL